MSVPEFIRLIAKSEEDLKQARELLAESEKARDDNLGKLANALSVTPAAAAKVVEAVTGELPSGAAIEPVRKRRRGSRKTLTPTENKKAILAIAAQMPGPLVESAVVSRRVRRQHPSIDAKSVRYYLEQQYEKVEKGVYSRKSATPLST